MNQCDSEFCIFDKKKKTPNILIPAVNLINGDNNENIYYLKAADEFIRFNFDKIFLYDINKNYNIENIKYEINEHEILVLQSSINHLIFDEKINIKNKFENYTFLIHFTLIMMNYLNQLIQKITTLIEKQLQVESFGQPIGEKIKINVPKLKIDSIKKLYAIKEENNVSKDELTEKENYPKMMK